MHKMLSKKKDEMNEIKNYIKKCDGFAHIYLRLFNPLRIRMGLHHTRVGFKKLIHVAPIERVIELSACSVYFCTTMLVNLFNLCTALFHSPKKKKNATRYDTHSDEL